MSKPTPGPWSWDESRETVYVVEDDDHVTTIVYGNVDPDDPAEGRANLRLIAQAPRLLQAGKHLVIKLADCYRIAGVDASECRALREFIDAAKEAEGRS